MSINPFYRDPSGPYVSLLRDRDAGLSVSEAKLNEAAQRVLTAGITRPFIKVVQQDNCITS